MKRNDAIEWVIALKGKYSDRKGKNRLHNMDGTMCCLGVLCDINGVEWIKSSFGDYFAADDTLSGTLSNEQVKSWGVSHAQCVELAGINDKSDTFEPVIKKIHELYIDIEE